MEKLGKYEMDSTLTNKNAGYCMWGFGKKNGKEYFIKQFEDQKYPADDKESSPERLAKKLKACERFEKKKKALYQAVNDNSDGNAVRIEEFFRVGSKYYVAMPKIKALRMSNEDIAKLPMGEKKRICAIIAHGVGSLHNGHLIHADLKPDNILFTKTEAGYTTAKIIDYDAGFLETAPPDSGEEIVGDFHYFSPEACRSSWGEEVELTCKMDVFALGVLFHQYLTGKLPGYNTEESAYSGIAVAKGEVLKVSAELPKDLRELLAQMLSGDPEKRPTAMSVCNTLRGKVSSSNHSSTVNNSPKSNNSFFRPGDL